ncbi:ERV/ALR sulfhydryl oxidase domain-containing protein [Kockiozyma suomiensis]|uniref:ERV/ALR sulfhydryl oxidase domain-containing protein n=1 Tax=Kockiozyma suomiensis TaxID=1337062 RepID=UPI003343A659
MAKLVIRRSGLLLAVAIASVIVFLFTLSSSDVSTQTHPRRPVIQKPGSSSSLSRSGSNSYGIAEASDYDPLQGPVPVASQKVSQGGPIMPHLGNETIKAELGRASWMLLHTILARYPEKPTSEEREALSAYIYLFSRVYPCGECAAHFQKLLKQFPPQTSSRIAASQWGCHVHNKVNARLGKEIFDCNEIAERYQCGCEDAEQSDKSDGSGSSNDADKSAARAEKSVGSPTKSEQGATGEKMKRIAEKDLSSEFLEVERRFQN